MDFGAVRPDAAFAVTDDRVVLPAVPDVGDGPDEFVGLRVAVGVLGVEPLAASGVTVDLARRRAPS